MFKKHNRVKREDFDNVFKNGKIIHEDSLYVRYLNSDDKQISVVVPKKVLKKAFARNRLKRLINSELRSVEENIPNGKYIFFIKKDLRENKEGIKDQINSLIEKI